MNPPTLRQLQYLVALAEDLHFSDAAARCGVSQPNLSAQIKELERNLGSQLVERTSRGVLLTPIGKSVAERAREVTRNVSDLMELAGAVNNPLTGRLRMGVIPTIAPYILPRVLPAVRQTYPGLELQLVEDFTDRLIPRLRSGELDVVFLAVPEQLLGLTTAVLGEEPFVVLAPANHPLAKKKTIEQKSFDATDLLLLQEGHCLRDQALDLCTVSTNQRAPVEGSSLSTLVQMVANGLGITLLPLIAVTVDMPSGNEARALPFRTPEPVRTLGLVWREGAGRDDAYQELAVLFRSEVQRLLVSARASLNESTRIRPVAN